jgi:hypothetical protein
MNESDIGSAEVRAKIRKTVQKKSSFGLVLHKRPLSCVAIEPAHSRRARKAHDENRQMSESALPRHRRIEIHGGLFH